MAATAAITGAGGKLQVDVGAGYVDVVEVVSITGPQITVADVDATNLQSPSVAKEFIPGFIDGGVVSMEANYTKAQMNTLYAQIRVSRSWKLLFSDASNWVFTGYINALSSENPLEEEVSMPFSVKVSGKPTFSQS